MGKVTKKAIVEAVSELTGVKAEYFGIDKFEGEYYWTGKAASLFDETNTYLKFLGDVPLARWVEDFNFKLTKWKESQLGTESDINKVIEQIDWVVEYE